MGRRQLGLLVAWCLLIGAEVGAGPVVLTVDPGQPGRLFEGIGAVSAGASSRLLIEYPEPARSEVLDYLFRPDFGAGFQHLKVEIGGEVNSTDGIELTHLREPGRENDRRGYEWWLMAEARRRNPAEVLDSLAWGAPGWIGGGKFYSPDMADYVVQFLQGAQRTYHLDIAYTGIWNETAHNSKWIKLLRRKLDAAGLRRVGIVAADNYTDNGWKIVREMAKDPELRAAVARVGVHYRDSHSPADAQACGCPLWSSEDGPWRGDWEGARRIAQTLNRNYITGRFTKTEIWSPVTSYYDSLPLPGSGVMRANEPWSGHYEVQPAVWAVAHTTQFAQPGWHYLDPGCELFDGGSVVSLCSPDGHDFSAIVETMAARSPQTIEWDAPRWGRQTWHIWRTTRDRQFERVADVATTAGRFKLTADPGCLYSITTTTGQHKGETQPPPAHPLPLPYHDDFSVYRPGDSPRLFSDQAGVFEVEQGDGATGRVLAEVLRRDGIQWPNHKDPEPETVMCDLSWRDYTVAADVRVEPAGQVALLGRVSRVPQNDHRPGCYYFQISAGGAWELRAIHTVVAGQPWEYRITGETGAPLAAGRVDFSPAVWHHLELTMHGREISAFADGRRLAAVTDATQMQGQIGLACGWSGAQFARLEVRPK